MTVNVHPAAAKYLEKLPEPYKGKIKAALKKLEREPPEGDIRPITGQQGTWRLRVGGYRALYRIDNDTILVTHIDPRGQVYTKKNRRKK